VVHGDATNEKAVVYKVPAGSTITVDGTNYGFEFPAKWVPQPLNSLQFVLAADQSFSAKWNQDSPRLELSSNTLVPNPGSRPFAGLKHGQRGVIAIGNLKGSKFAVVWVGQLEVE